jgi:hypothetical protein
MVGPDHEILYFFLYKRRRKENRSQGSGGKQGEINLTFGNRPFLTRLVSRGRYNSDTTCHAPILRNKTEASIHVHRMLKTHV